MIEKPIVENNLHPLLSVGILDRKLGSLDI